MVIERENEEGESEVETCTCVHVQCVYKLSRRLSLSMPPGEKQSGEQVEFLGSVSKIW